MDDDYELVPKDLISRLKEENNKLKDELLKRPTEKDIKSKIDSDTISQIVQVLHDESQKERELILDNLNEIKDLNKTTLDNLLVNTQKLDERLESMVQTISGLVESLSHIVESLSGNEKIQSELRDIVFKLSGNDNITQETPSDETVMKKLTDIETFMKNLRVLLSYVKPSDMVIDKKK